MPDFILARQFNMIISMIDLFDWEVNGFGDGSINVLFRYAKASDLENQPCNEFAPHLCNYLMDRKTRLIRKVDKITLYNGIEDETFHIYGRGLEHYKRPGDNDFGVNWLIELSSHRIHPSLGILIKQ